MSEPWWESLVCSDCGQPFDSYPFMKNRLGAAVHAVCPPKPESVPESVPHGFQERTFIATPPTPQARLRGLYYGLDAIAWRIRYLTEDLDKMLRGKR